MTAHLWTHLGERGLINLRSTAPCGLGSAIDQITDAERRGDPALAKKA
jgi:hypothetical protein